MEATQQVSGDGPEFPCRTTTKYIGTFIHSSSTFKGRIMEFKLMPCIVLLPIRWVRFDLSLDRLCSFTIDSSPEILYKVRT